MCAPVEEYSYDHPMCGPAMYNIHLVDEAIGTNILLRADGPCDDGRPCFLMMEFWLLSNWY